MASRFHQKLLVPTAARPLVERLNLTAQIEQAVATRRVVALTAPAGWGKTTALAQWAARSVLPVAWYTLDRADRDPHLFLDYLLQAVAPFVCSAQQLGAQLSTTAPRNLADLYQAAALEIAAAETPFALVLDDFHLLEEEPSPDLPGAALIFELIGAMIEYATNCHVVLASRTLPARQGLARMGVQQRATVIDYHALQFGAADVRDLARLAHGGALDDQRAARLVARLDGWIAGIVLSMDQAIHGEAGQPQGDVVDKAQIYDFVAEQMIAPLDPALQGFLEDSSVLEDLSPQRCNVLRQRGDSAQFLNEARSRGFLAARRGEWLAYHSLFREFLRARLAQDTERERALLRRAGDIYRADEDIERALECYLEAQSTEQAIELLQEAAPRFMQLSRQTVLLSCFERLAAHLAQSGRRRFLPPALLLVQARVYRDLALWDRAELAAQLAETLGEAETRWEAIIQQAALLNFQGDHARARKVLDALDPAALPPQLQFAYYETAGRVRVQAGMIAEGIAALEQAHALALTTAQAANDPDTLGNLSDLLGWAYGLGGDYAAARRHLQRADACWQASGNAGRRAATLNNLGMLAIEDGRYLEARAALEQGLPIAQETARRREELDLLISLGELDLIEGRFGRAVASFRAAHALAMQTNLTRRGEVAAASALWALAIQGDSDGAESWRQLLLSHEDQASPEAVARRALAESTILLRQPRPDIARLSGLIGQVSAVESALQPPERIALALLRASLALDRGWPEAAPHWEVFARHSAGLSEALLGPFVALHRRLFESAAPHSALARRLLAARESAAPRRWSIQALGTFACVVDGVACDLSPLHRALLVYLLDAGSKGRAVEQLWEAVWGDCDLSMPALHQALYRLRAQTGLEAAAREGICRINTPVDSIDYDVRALEKLLDEPASHQTIQQALAIYQGDFLPSAPLSAAQWADARRSYLRQRFLDLLEEHARALEDTAPDQAIQHYQRILQIDSCREQTAVQLMRLALRVGNHLLLVETFNHLAGALRALGLSPEPSTRALLNSRAPGKTAMPQASA